MSSGLTDHQRERLGALNRALGALARQVEQWRPTVPALVAVELELRRIDNTVERALTVELYAPELDARRQAIDVIVGCTAPVAVAFRAGVVNDLEGAVALLSSVLPISWNGSDASGPRWLTPRWLLFGRDALELTRVKQAGLVSRLLGDDVVWFERDDGEVVSFAVPHAKTLKVALEARGLTLQASQVVAGAAEERLRRLCRDHLFALESFSRNLPRLPDVSSLAFTTGEMTLERLELLERQSAFLGGDGPELARRIVQGRRKLTSRLLELLRHVGQAHGDSNDYLALFDLLSPHLPLEEAGSGVMRKPQ